MPSAKCQPSVSAGFYFDFFWIAYAAAQAIHCTIIYILARSEVQPQDICQQSCGPKSSGVCILGLICNACQKETVGSTISFCLNTCFLLFDIRLGEWNNRFFQQVRPLRAGGCRSVWRGKLCWHCHQRGHDQKDCRELLSGASRRCQSAWPQQHTSFTGIVIRDGFKVKACKGSETSLGLWWDPEVWLNMIYREMILQSFIHLQFSQLSIGRMPCKALLYLPVIGPFECLGASGLWPGCHTTKCASFGFNQSSNMVQWCW